MTKKEHKKTCETCGGTGQVSFFKGVSRFLLSSEECDACAGTGFTLEPTGGEAEHGRMPGGRKRKVKKK